MSSNVRRRRRTVEERLGAAVRHLRPGDLAGRGEPLPRDRGATRVSGGGPGEDGDRGAHIEHVTLEASASQTIASGGAGMSWGQIVGPPTERRGFETLSAQIATGPVVAIPIDATGVLNFILEGRWASWRGSGDLTVVKTARSGNTESRTYSIARHGPSTRVFGGDDDGWEVDAGDTMSFQVPNGSGSGQTLAAATLVQKIIVLSESTSKAKDPIDVLWLDEQTNGASNHAVGSATLTSGQTYTIVVRGNSNVLPNSEGPMVEGNPDDIIYPSDSPGNSLQAAYDYAFAYAGKSGATGLPALRVEDYNLAPGGGWHEIDLGSGGQRVTPIGGWPSSPDAEHRYYLEVAGGGQPIEIWTTDGDDNPSVLSDNNGQYRYEIYEGTL